MANEPQTQEQREKEHELHRHEELQKSQLLALETVLKKLADEDEASQRRVAKAMLVEIEKDQAGALEKVLGQIMRGNAHATADYHLAYFMRLEPMANRLREVANPPTSEADLSAAQNRAMLKPRVV